MTARGQHEVEVEEEQEGEGSRGEMGCRERQGEEVCVIWGR